MHRLLALGLVLAACGHPHGNGSDAGDDDGSDDGGTGSGDGGTGSGDGGNTGSGAVTTWEVLPAHCDGTFIPGDFRSIWFADTHHGFAVGTGGMYQSSDGVTWHCTDPSTSMNGVSGRSANNAYAVGTGPGGYARVMRWNGRAWATKTYAAGPTLYGVWSADGGDLWVAGQGFIEKAPGDGSPLVYEMGDGNQSSWGVWGTDA